MKHPNRNRKGLLTLFFVLNTVHLFAQQTFKYEAVLQKVNADGFYSISLQPSLLAKSKADFADIRILDQNRQFVPYIFGNQLLFEGQQNFVTFPQLKIPSRTDTLTTFVVENKDRLTINQLCLILRNTSVQRTVSLSGSDDLNKWYAIKENIILEDADSNNDGRGTYQQVLNFPSSTYRYLKVQINNKNKEAVAILQAGIYLRQYFKPDYIPLKNVTFTQKDSTGLSRISINLDDNYQVNKLQLHLTGQKYYKRNLRIYKVSGKSGKTISLISDTLISSSATGDLTFSVKTNKILLEILNGDNPALTVKAVEAFQLKQSIISYLEKDKLYRLVFGDPKAAAPDYDLKFFADSLQHTLLQISHADVKVNAAYRPGKPANKKQTSAWLIWGAILAVILALAFLTFKMTQEINKRSAEDNI